MSAKFQKIKSDSIKLQSVVVPQKVDVCKMLISQYGVLAPPVVGDIDGTKTLIYGDCELSALIELNTDYAEAMVVSLKDKNEANKLSLMLMELKGAPDAVDEGKLINELVASGLYTQSQIAGFLSKSVSWVNKRLSLSTRLSPEVKDMVRQMMLSAQTAQEIARMPLETQHDFSCKVVGSKIPKSSVEKLVSEYSRADCPDDLKSLILDDPFRAMGMISEKPSRQKTTMSTSNPNKKQSTSIDRYELEDVIIFCHTNISTLAGLIYQATSVTLLKNERALKQLFLDIDAIMKIISKNLDEINFPQGKTAEKQ